MQQADHLNATANVQPKTLAGHALPAKEDVIGGFRHAECNLAFALDSGITSEPRFMKGKPVNDSQRYSLRVIQSLRGEASHTT